MKANNISRIRLGREEFFKTWLIVLKPFHKLTDRLINVAAMFLEKREELSRTIKDESVINKIIMTRETKNEIRDKSNLTKSHFQMVMTKLRRSGFITKNGINMKYIPDIQQSDNSFGLFFHFEFYDTERDNQKGC